jgi:hypothetical protein
MTRENGHFRIMDIPAGSYVLLVRRIGYQPIMHPVEVAAGDTLRPSFVLSRLEQVLPTVTIVESGRPGRLAEFERRRQIGVGSFMTEEQITNVRAIAPGDLFRRMNGLTVTAPPRGFGRTVRGPGARCMDIYVDDAPFPESDVDLLPPARFIAGIEVYSNPALVPPKYANLSRRCGIILIWLR